MARRRALPWLCLAALWSSARCSSICPLPWNADPTLPHGVNKSKICPYGYAKRPWDVTVPLDPSLVEWICVVYGYIPWMLIPACFVDSLIRACINGGVLTRDAAFLLFVLSLIGVNELFIKPFLKLPRPEHSCNLTCGFPSSHSTLAMGFFTLLFLDGIFRVRPKVPLSADAARRRARGLKGHKPVHWLKLGWRFWLSFEKKYSTRVVPLSRDDTMDAFDFFMFVQGWFWLLIPVPFSRVVLNDHTPEQVMVGSSTGMIMAVLWFTAVRHLGLRKHNHLLGTRVWKIFIHNYALPRFEVFSRCLCRLAEYEEEAVCAAKAAQDDKSDEVNASMVLIDATPKRLRNLVRMQQELAWYMSHPATAVIFPEDKLYYEIELEDFSKLQERLNRFSRRMNPNNNIRPMSSAELLSARTEGVELTEPLPSRRDTTHTTVSALGVELTSPRPARC